MKGEVGANGRLVKQVFTEKIVGTVPRGRLHLFSLHNFDLYISIIRPTFCLISHGSPCYILLSWQHAVNLLRYLSTAAIGCQNYSNMCQVLFDKV